MATATFVDWVLAVLLILSSVGVILARKPVYASLSFLLSLLILSALYLQLSAQFIAVMQVLVYAGAILVIFMFVIVLFQDAHLQISAYASKCSSFLLTAAAGALLIGLFLIGYQLTTFNPIQKSLPQSYGEVQTIGKTLYLDFFFPFEAVAFLFLAAVVGALYIAKKVK